jgi:hypothetical protein
MPPGATQQEDIPKANVKARKAITLEELRKFDDFLTDYLVDHVSADMFRKSFKLIPCKGVLLGENS